MTGTVMQLMWTLQVGPVYIALFIHKEQRKMPALKGPYKNV
jgi:hypothetical protein